MNNGNLERRGNEQENFGAVPEFWENSQSGNLLGRNVGKTEQDMINSLEEKSIIVGDATDLAAMPPMLGDEEDNKTIEERNPEVAVDGNKIEKVWVERTKEVIKETKGDPREKAVQVNELKADYLAKRFNRRLGDRN